MWQQCRGRPAAPLSPRGWFERSPFRKFTRHGVFPLAPLFHLCLVALTSWQVVTRNDVWADYVLGTVSNNCFFFFPPACYDNDDCSTLRVGDACVLSSVNSTLAALAHAVDGYYTLGARSISSYRPQTYDHTDESDEIVPPVLTYEDGKGRTEVFDLPQGQPYGPFVDADTTRTLLHKCAALRLSFRFADKFYRDVTDACYDWKVELIWRADGGDFRFQTEHMYVTANGCDKAFDDDAATNARAIEPRTLDYVQATTLVLAVAYFMLLAKDVFTSAQLLRIATKRHAERHWANLGFPGPGADNKPIRIAHIRTAADQDDAFAPMLPERPPRPQLAPPAISWRTKLYFFNGWVLPMALASALTIASDVKLLFFASSNDGYRRREWRACEGLSCGLFWLGVLSYLRFNEGLFALAHILFRALPRVGEILLSVMPAFIGAILLAYAVLATKVDYFGTIDLTTNSLFSLLNGDVIWNMYGIVTNHVGWVGGIFLTLFFFLFTYLVLNICLTTVELCVEVIGAYLAARQMERQAQRTTKARLESSRSFSFATGSFDSDGGGGGSGSVGRARSPPSSPSPPRLIEAARSPAGMNAIGRPGVGMEETKEGSLLDDHLGSKRVFSVLTSLDDPAEDLSKMDQAGVTDSPSNPTTAPRGASEGGERRARRPTLRTQVSNTSAVLPEEMARTGGPLWAAVHTGGLRDKFDEEGYDAHRNQRLFFEVLALASATEQAQRRQARLEETSGQPLSLFDDLGLKRVLQSLYDRSITTLTRDGSYDDLAVAAAEAAAEATTADPTQTTTWVRLSRSDHELDAAAAEAGRAGSERSNGLSFYSVRESDSRHSQLPPGVRFEWDSDHDSTTSHRCSGLSNGSGGGRVSI